jgi:hypothetical protein
MISATLSSLSLAAPSHGLIATGFVTCIERVEAGQFTIPSFVLFGLPVGTGAPFLAGGPSTDARSIVASLSVSSISRLDQNTFLAPGLDAGFFVWLNANTINVSYNQ